MSGQYEKETLRYLDSIAKSCAQQANAVVEIGRMLKEHLAAPADLSKLKEQTEKLVELTTLLEKTQPGQYVPDVDGRMKAVEWMHNLSAHYEFVSPKEQWDDTKITKEEFWDMIDTYMNLNLILKTKPEPVKDANQLEIPELVTIAEQDERVRPVGFPDTELHNNINDCNAAGCPGCSETQGKDNG